MEQRIYNRTNLTVFEKRINSFKAKDDFDTECLGVAKEAFAIYQTYPNENVFRNAKPNGEASEEDMENIIGMEKYISFYADHKGWLNETLIESVNTEIQDVKGNVERFLENFCVLLSITLKQSKNVFFKIAFRD